MVGVSGEIVLNILNFYLTMSRGEKMMRLG